MAKREVSLVKTAFVRMWSLFKVPLIFLLRPVIIELNSERAELRLPLNRLSKNHMNSMYLSALVTGADLAVGILAMEALDLKNAKASFIFKDLEASFLRRAEADVHFVCEEGDAVGDLIVRALESGRREERKVYIRAFCPSISEEPVAKFALTLSLKKKGR